MARLRCIGWNCESFARQLGFCGPFAGSLARQLGFHGEFGGSLARELGFHGLFAGSLAPELTFMVSLLEVSRGGSIQEGLHRTQDWVSWCICVVCGGSHGLSLGSS